MAKTQTTKDEAPLSQLNDDAVKHLDAIGAELDEAEKDLEALQDIGMDVTRLKERIAWGRKARGIILRRYGKKE